MSEVPSSAPEPVTLSVEQQVQAEVDRVLQERLGSAAPAAPGAELTPKEQAQAAVAKAKAHLTDPATGGGWQAAVETVLPVIETLVEHLL